MSATKGRVDQQPAGPTYPIESVDNVLRLLLMVSDRRQIRVSEAAADLGTAVSTAHRLLAMLTHHGFVTQDAESKVYRAGPVLLRIGLAAARNSDIRTLVRPLADELRDQTGETVHVAVLQGDEMLFLVCAESPNALRVASRVGTLMWAHCTSVGKAWLACETDEALKSLYPSPKIPALTDRSITSRAVLLRELAEVRQQGFARNVGESELGVGSVSAAARDAAGRPVASISVSIPLVRMSDDRWGVLTEAVLRSRAAIESSLP